MPTELFIPRQLLPLPPFYLALLPFASLYDYLPFSSAKDKENRWSVPESAALCAGKEQRFSFALSMRADDCVAVKDKASFVIYAIGLQRCRPAVSCVRI